MSRWEQVRRGVLAFGRQSVRDGFISHVMGLVLLLVLLGVWGLIWLLWQHAKRYLGLVVLALSACLGGCAPVVSQVGAACPMDETSAEVVTGIVALSLAAIDMIRRILFPVVLLACLGLGCATAPPPCHCTCTFPAGAGLPAPVVRDIEGDFRDQLDRKQAGHEQRARDKKRLFAPSEPPHPKAKAVGGRGKP